MRDWLPERLPEDVEAERGLLATICAPGMDVQAAEILTGMSPEDFVAPQHRAIFTAALALVLRGEELHALNLKSELEGAKALNSVGGFAGLVEIMAGEELGRPHTLAKRLRGHRQARELVKLGAKLVREVSDDPRDVQETAQRFAQAALGATEGPRTGPGHPRKASDALQGILDDRMNRTERPRAILTGFGRLDRATGGFHPGNLIVVAGRPGLGKTALALQWALTTAQIGVRAGIWSLEMTDEELADRLTAQLGYLPAGWSRWNDLTDGQIGKGMAARDYLRELPIEVCDSAPLTVPMIRLALMKARAKGDPFGIVVVDYLQLMDPADSQKASKQNEATKVGDISRGLKLLAKEFGIPIVLLSQLNRDVDNRPGGRARLSDLRDSGAIEQDADIVVFVNRGTDPMTGKPHADGDLTIAKTRHGVCDSVPITFDGSKMTFLERIHETGPSTGAEAEQLGLGIDKSW